MDFKLFNLPLIFTALLTIKGLVADSETELVFSDDEFLKISEEIVEVEVVDLLWKGNRCFGDVYVFEVIESFKGNVVKGERINVVFPKIRFSLQMSYIQNSNRKLLFLNKTSDVFYRHCPLGDAQKVVDRSSLWVPAGMKGGVYHLDGGGEKNANGFELINCSGDALLFEGNKDIYNSSKNMVDTNTCVKISGNYSNLKKEILKLIEERQVSD